MKSASAPSKRQVPKRPLIEASCVFDFFLDIPHPAASSKNERARIIEPPGQCHPGILELFDSTNISRIAMFAFPDYDAENDKDEEINQGGILNRHDLDFFSTSSFNHTFSLLLDSGLRVYAHVLRYLPIHSQVKLRLDVGRRAGRAMVILTRAVGGEQFYSSLLKTVQAISIEKMVVNDLRLKQNLVTAFLHAIFKRHFLLRARCAAVLDKKTMKILAEEFKTLTIHGAEIYQLSFHDEDGGGKRLFMDKDIVSLRLPLSLQPGYDGNNFTYECEDEDSPILPLLRCLGAGKTIRILSAMLCEVRIIFISKYVDTISSCVRAAMAMLAQGLLVWRHVSIPVLPPHLFRFLSAGAPYIVGVLERYADRIERVRGLKDVLSINLDKGNLTIYNMDDPKKKVPDLMESGKTNRKQKNFIGTEMLARDLNEVLEVDRKLWGINADAPEDPDGDILNSARRRSSALSTKSLEKEPANSAKKLNDDFFDAAALFVGTMQGSSDERGSPTETNIKPEDTQEHHVELASKPITKRSFTLCQNDQGEEMLRSSLICFFLELFGDIGMYLLMSKSTGALKVDKKKFLVRKTQMGVGDKTPMWYVLKRFSRSVMFERFVTGRIEDAERQAQKLSPILLDHLPIFALCQKHLRKTKSTFTTSEIRRVVFTTIEGCPQHRLVEKLEDVRERALALTSEKPFEGDEVAEIKKLIEECKGCNLSLSQVVAVSWMRIGETKSSHWKHNLLGMHLLKNFVLHGPISSISSALDGIAQIYALRFYENKNVEAAKGIQKLATQLYFLLNNCALTFSRRRKALASNVQKKVDDESMSWSNYLIRRLPHDVGFRHIHVMFSPSENTKPSPSGAKKEIEVETDPENYSAIPSRKLGHTHGSSSPTRQGDVRSQIYRRSSTEMSGSVRAIVGESEQYNGFNQNRQGPNGVGNPNPGAPIMNTYMNGNAGNQHSGMMNNTMMTDAYGGQINGIRTLKETSGMRP